MAAAGAAAVADKSTVVYRTKEVLYEAFDSFLVKSETGAEKFRIKFLDTEWLILLKYRHAADNSLSYVSSVTLTQSAAEVVKASLLLKMHTSAAAALDDDWGGSADDPLAGKWCRSDFAVGQTLHSPSKSKNTRPLIGTTVVLEAEFRFFDMAIRPVAAIAADAAVNDTETRFQNYVKGMYPKMAHSDVILVAEAGEEFLAHKFVLSCHSQYFAGHLTHDPQEKLKLNTTAAVAQEMIRFMYTSEVEQMETMAFELLQAADYYSIVDLMNKCADYLAAHLSPHNVIRVIDYANRADLKQLAAAAVRSFISNIHNEEWKAQFAPLPLAAQLIIRSLADMSRDAAQEDLKKKGLHRIRSPNSLPDPRKIRA